MNELAEKPRAPLFRSDSLPDMAEILRLMAGAGAANHFARRWTFVIDSSFIISDLVWLTKNRRDPSARTALQEAIAASVIVPFVPPLLSEEVEKRLPSLSEEIGVQVGILWTCWKEYQETLIFYAAPVVLPEGDVRDPNDLPFVELSKAVGAVAVLAQDKDFEDMGVRKAGANAVRILRDYGRAAAEATGCFAGAVLCTAVLFSVLSAMFVAVFGFCRRSPLIALGIFAIFGVITYFFWSRIRRVSRVLFTWENAEIVGDKLMEAGAFVGQLVEAADAAEQTVKRELGLPAHAGAR